MPNLTREVAYLLLIFGLMVIPRFMQRFRIPAPVSSFGLGMAATLFLGSFSQDVTLSLLATLGISSLFLFAGLEVDVDDFRRGKWPLFWHLVLRLVVLVALVFLAMYSFEFTWQISALLALAIVTPSTGFILDTLPMLDINDDERYWIRMKAISGELFALLALFVVLQSGSLETLAWSTAALSGMIVSVPLIFFWLGKVVIPHARGSEFSLLLMVGVISAYLTYKLGVYYLVGAFLAGFIAKMLKKRLPMLASEENLHAIQMFASFFVPFYFFYKGMGVPGGALTQDSLILGAAITLLALPFRVGVVWTQRRFMKGETGMGSLRVATALTPTLIFTLVLASILRERFQISEVIYGGLLIYAGMSTLLPAIFMNKPVNFDLLPGGSTVDD
jgi:Kef-type K+ transport system membrane component KefB